MGVNVQTDRRPIISSIRVDPHNQGDITGAHCRVGGRRNPVLGAGLTIPKIQRRQLGHRVVRVGGAVVGASTLGGDELGERPVSDSGTAIGILQAPCVSVVCDQDWGNRVAYQVNGVSAVS